MTYKTFFVAVKVGMLDEILDGCVSLVVHSSAYHPGHV